jgi:hypothetical protein
LQSTQARSWLVLTEANRFIWPGPDLRTRQSGDAASVAHGPLPYTLFETIRRRFIDVPKSRSAATVSRQA